MTSRAWKGASSRPWARVRQRVLDENLRTNEGRCVLKIPGVCTTTAREVHHLLGRAMTGDDPRYLVAVCRACNLKVGDPMRGAVPHRPVTRW